MDTSSSSDDFYFEKYVRDQDAKNTVYSNNNAVRTMKRYMATFGETRDICQLAPNILDGLLGRFFIEVRKIKNNEPYEPDCLSCMHRALSRYLLNNRYSYNILKDKEFATSRKVLAARRKELRKMGYGGKPNKTRELDADEVDFLFTEGYFGQGMWCVRAHLGGICLSTAVSEEMMKQEN